MMKRKKDDVLRLTVMVRPDNDRDPAQKLGLTGKIVAFFPEKQITTVRFKDRSQGVYLPPALITLRSAKEILQALNVGLFINHADCIIMLKVYRLALIGRYTKALKLTTVNSTTLFYCTVSCVKFFEDIVKPQSSLSISVTAKN